MSHTARPNRNVSQRPESRSEQAASSGPSAAQPNSPPGPSTNPSAEVWTQWMIFRIAGAPCREGAVESWSEPTTRSRHAPQAALRETRRTTNQTSAQPASTSRTDETTLAFRSTRPQFAPSR